MRRGADSSVPASPAATSPWPSAGSLPKTNGSAADAGQQVAMFERDYPEPLGFQLEYARKTAHVPMPYPDIST